MAALPLQGEEHWSGLAGPRCELKRVWNGELGRLRIGIKGFGEGPAEFLSIDLQDGEVVGLQGQVGAGWRFAAAAANDGPVILALARREGEETRRGFGSNYTVPAAAVVRAGVGFNLKWVRIKAEGFKGVEVIAHVLSPDGGDGKEAGDGFEDGPVHRIFDF